MLKDENRIFTNLYGMHDRTLAGAQKRGHWDGTAALIKKFNGDACRLQKFSAAKAANTSANDGEIGHGVIRKL